MTPRRILALGALLGALVLSLLGAACGGSDESSGDGDDGAAAETAWQAVLDELGVTPDPGLLELTVTGSAPELDVMISVPENGRELAFGDGLYGVLVYSFEDGAWTRVDTADIRTEIAPLLGPGESATVTVPVEEAPSYRVLVPVDGSAVWVDVS